MKTKLFFLVVIATLAFGTTHAQLSRVYSSYEVSDGSSHFIPKDFSFDGTTYLFNHNYNSSSHPDPQISIFNSDLNLVNTLYIDNLERVYFYDFDQLAAGETMIDIALTQTLFNSDREYEYFVSDTTDNGILYHLMSNGNVIQTFAPRQERYSNGKFDGSYIFVLKIDGKYYLALTESGLSKGGIDDAPCQFYRINRSSVNSIFEPVESDFAMRVFPSVARRSQPITVQLGANNNATEVAIIDATGRIVKRVSVEKGQREVVIPTDDLPQGVNILNAADSQSQQSYKIVIQ